MGGDCWAEHGFSAVIDFSWDRMATRRILFDTGASGEILIHNLQVNGIQPETIDFVFLSHGHRDHTGGLQALAGLPGIDFTLLAHPTICRQVISTRPELRRVGADSRLLQNLPADRIIQTKDPVEIYPHVYSTGSIPRTTEFESAREGIFQLQDGKMVPDEDPDDMALVFDLGCAGLAVLTGCCHAGLINTLVHAQQITGKQQIHSVTGGLHLMDADESRLEHTISHLTGLQPQAVHTGHCTGQQAEFALRESLGEVHHLLSAGLSIQLPYQR